MTIMIALKYNVSCRGFYSSVPNMNVIFYIEVPEAIYTHLD